MKSRLSKITDILMAVCFSIAAAVGVLFFAGELFLFPNNNLNYAEKQAEITTVETIDAVRLATDGEKDYVYVCYDRGSCVNVYDGDGAFLWAVSIPLYRNGKTLFDVIDGKLIIWHDYAYVYNAFNGSFEERADYEKYTYTEKPESDSVKPESPGYYCDLLSVFRVDESGNRTYIVNKPTWHLLFSAALCWPLAFFGALAGAVLLLVKRLSAYNRVIKEDSTAAGTTDGGTDDSGFIEAGNAYKTEREKRFKKAFSYMNRTAICNFACAALTFVLVLCGFGYAALSIIAVGIHFFVLMAVTGKLLGGDVARWSDAEQAKYKKLTISVFASAAAVALAIAIAFNIVGL
ncbi:MAG: hypothetical protein IKX92_01815 [Clostridia bacterium]|nr:hypothetical protein [Clostridia bacterium]